MFRYRVAGKSDRLQIATDGIAGSRNRAGHFGNCRKLNYYTSGSPYLVGKLCKFIDEDLIDTQGGSMNNKLTLIYWETEDGAWRGKLAEFPNLFAEGETLKELEDNIYDEYEAMILDGVEDRFEVKEILG